MIRNVTALLGWIAITFLAAAIGSAASINAAEFYGELHQPAWAPPPWLFGPVWSLLYSAMAIAAWLVWLRGGWRDASSALGPYLAQLAVNALWSWVFFVWHQGALAFVNILVLIAMVAVLTLRVWQIRPAAALLFAPYLAWICFAAALNLTLWLMNPGVL